MEVEGGLWEVTLGSVPGDGIARWGLPVSLVESPEWDGFPSTVLLTLVPGKLQLE